MCEKIELGLNDNTSMSGIKEYKLIQYTPHIHFQPDEPGACLRASEVKPKLDTFIRRFADGNRIVIPEQCEIVDKDNRNKDVRKPALNYSISIKADGIVSRPDFPRFSTFFGNMGDAHKKKGVYYEKGLNILFYAPDNCTGLDLSEIEKSKEANILDLIDYVLPAFFSFNCFGTRSTKGWGSYGVEGRDVSNEYLGKFAEVYYRVPLIDDKNKWEDRLEVVRVLSGMMKGGFNHGGYYKGRIFKYFTEKGIGSDKAYMKQFVLPGPLDKHKESESKKKYDTFYYSRGIIGLAGKYEFKAGPRTKREGIIGVFDKNSKKVCGSGENVIDRFNNPIHFIPRKDHIIVLPTAIPQELLDTGFVFAEINKKGDLKEELKEGQKEGLSLPLEFNLTDFLDYFFKQLRERVDFPVENTKGSLYALNKIKKDEKNEYITVKYKRGEECEIR